MFYIKDNNNIEFFEKLKKHSLEFCLVMKQKKYFEDAIIYSDLNKENYFLKIDKNKYMTPKGAIGSYQLARYLGIEFNNKEDIIKNITEANENFSQFDVDIFSEFNDKLKYSHNLEREVEVKDKNNDTYTISIFNNVDLFVRLPMLNDRLILKKNNKKIGFINTLYSETNMVERIKNNHELLYLVSKKDFPLFDNEEDVKFKMEEKDISLNTFNKKLVSQDMETIIGFENKPFIEYSDIEEEYKGKGLGFQMYVEFSKYLTQKDSGLYSSTLQSDDAELLWSNIKKHIPNYIKEENIFSNENKARYCLKVPEKYKCDFRSKIKNRKKIS